MSIRVTEHFERVPYSISGFIARAVTERAEATEALLADVVCATPVEHLWRLAIIEPGPQSTFGEKGRAVFFEFELPSVCSMIPDIIGGIVYNSTPPAEMLALRNAELERRAA